MVVDTKNPSQQQTDKERACAAVVEAYGEEWYAGPRVRGANGKVYMADIAIPSRRLAVEMRSSDEVRKISPERLAAFEQAGWRIILVHSPAELEERLKEDDQAMAESSKQLRNKLQDYLSKAVRMNDNQIRLVAAYALLGMLSRRKRVFETVPYLDIKGTSGSGKSTLGRVLKGLWGTSISGGTTPAAMYRWLSSHVGWPYIMDEAGAVLRGKMKDAYRQVLLNGDSRDGKVHVADQKNQHGLVPYRVFGPKVLISIRGVDPSALARRTIEITMEKAPLSFSSRRDLKEEKALRKAMKRWSREYASRVQERDEAYRNSEEFAPGRTFLDQDHRNLWAPMLATANVLGIDLALVCAAHGQAARERATIKLHDTLADLLPTLPRGRHYLRDLRERLQERWGDRADHWNEFSISNVLRKQMRRRVMKDTHRGAYLVIGPVPRKRRRA